MANGGPTVTLTLAGDEKKLTDAFDKVGAASKSMGDKVASTSSDFDKVGKSTDDFVEKADNVDTKAMGFRDTITGLQDTFKGLTDDSLSLGDRLFTLGAGVGDLASGFANLLIPALGKMGAALAATTAGTWLLTTAQTAWSAISGAVTAAMGALNAVLAANPILAVIAVIALLVGAFIWLWNNCEGFRNFFINMWHGIQNVVGAVVDWIVNAWNGVIDFFSKLPGRIGGFFSGLGDIIKNAFKGAVNWIIDRLNWFVDRINNIIYGINLINPFDDIPSVPHIPKLHTGGVVPGMPGQEVLMMLQGGERVSTSSQAGSGTRITFAGNTSDAFATAFMELVRTGVITIEAT